LPERHDERYLAAPAQRPLAPGVRSPVVLLRRLLAGRVHQEAEIWKLWRGAIVGGGTWLDGGDGIIDGGVDGHGCVVLSLGWHESREGLWLGCHWVGARWG
jgi:hypothetical protein